MAAAFVGWLACWICDDLSLTGFSSRRQALFGSQIRVSVKPMIFFLEPKVYGAIFDSKRAYM